MLEWNSLPITVHIAVELNDVNDLLYPWHHVIILGHTYNLTLTRQTDSGSSMQASNCK